MKIQTKFVFLLVFGLIFVSCGEKKSVYDGYPDQTDYDSNTPAADNDSAKTNDEDKESDEDTLSDNDDIIDTEITVDDDAATAPDEDIPAGDNDIETNDDTEEPMNCTGFSLDPDDELSGDIPSTIYHIKIADNILGNPDYEDIFELRLDHARVDGDPYVAAGTYDLADGDSWHNTNYWSCWECVSATQDRKTDSEKFYFQKSGTLTIESVDEKYNFQGTLSAVLVESTLDDYWVSSTVKNGSCIEIETSFKAKTLCSLGCGNVVCGETNACGILCETDCIPTL